MLGGLIGSFSEWMETDFLLLFLNKGPFVPRRKSAISACDFKISQVDDSVK